MFWRTSLTKFPLPQLTWTLCCRLNCGPPCRIWMRCGSHVPKLEPAQNVLAFVRASFFSWSCPHLLASSSQRSAASFYLSRCRPQTFLHFGGWCTLKTWIFWVQPWDFPQTVCIHYFPVFAPFQKSGRLCFP